MALGVAWIALGAPAWATPSAGSSAPTAPAASDEARAWLGRYCPPQGCSGRTDAPMASALGFALAVSVGGLLSRSRGSRSA